MTHEQHRLRHIELHASLDELVADWLAQTRGMPMTSSVFDLMQWSYRQTLKPTCNPFEGKAPAHIPSIEVDRG